MAKNYMADVAKMLGMELGHIFKIEGDSKTLYKFTTEGLVYYSEIFESWRHAGDYGDYNLIQLLRGSMIINQLPWKPKEERKHGHWKRTDRYWWECSVCGGKNWIGRLCEADSCKTPYCPHCGAKMDEDVSDDTGKS